MINEIIFTIASSFKNIIDIKKIYRAKYLKKYKQQRKSKFKELKITLDIKNYEKLKNEALKYKITPNKLIVKQALAYKNSNYLVPKNIDDDLKQLIFLFRNIANNINQATKHSNIFKKIIGTNKFITNLKTLEKNIIDFIQKPPLKQNDS